MLVLTRKLQEQIRIGDNVTITVLRVKGQAVRIGIEAPRELRVVRAELPRDKDLELQDSGAAETQPDIVANAEVEPSGKENPPASSAASSPVASRRLPQRRMINRHGAPPLRLACSHALAVAPR